uniref:Uncharacterized protein n=1 Tax=Schistocephalus solidus TaxID=70667 RepID=A0A0X3P9D2_SCHSO
MCPLSIYHDCMANFDKAILEQVCDLDISRTCTTLAHPRENALAQLPNRILNKLLKVFVKKQWGKLSSCVVVAYRTATPTSAGFVSCNFEWMHFPPSASMFLSPDS